MEESAVGPALVAFAICGTICFGMWLGHKSKTEKRRAAQDDRSASLADRVQELEQRVHTLERIAVDRKERLREEIDAL